MGPLIPKSPTEEPASVKLAFLKLKHFKLQHMLSLHQRAVFPPHPLSPFIFLQHESFIPRQ